MDLENKPRSMVANDERSKIDRKVLIWLNTCPVVKKHAVAVTIESQLAINEPGMAVSAVTSAYKSRTYITGGYQAEYRFALIYRIIPGGSPDKSLAANEVLNRIGGWAMEHFPDLGDGIAVQQVMPVSVAETYALYADGDEDHHIEIKITYEVKPNG